MRIETRVTKDQLDKFTAINKEWYIGTKKTAIRMLLALGLTRMLKGDKARETGSQNLSFNTGSVDPEGVFEVMAYYAISRRMGASRKKNKVIVTSSNDISAAMSEALIIALDSIPDDKDSLEHISHLYFSE